MRECGRHSEAEPAEYHGDLLRRLTDADYREMLAAHRAALPHDPMWNLLPRRRQVSLWECTWHGAVFGARCAACVREHAEYAEGGTWDDRRGPDWGVSAGGYRLVIEDGVILGLAYGEDPWQWGAPGWLVSHLVADAEMRAYTGMPHACDDRCACPRHGTAMIYWPRGDDHACQDADCPYGHGVRTFIGATLPA